MSYHAVRHGEGCPECGLPLCSEKCGSCHGAAPSWDYLCEECGGRGELLLCPRRHTTPQHCLANGRHGEAIGTIRRGKSAISERFRSAPRTG